MFKYDVYVPVHDNNGKDFPLAVMSKISQSLLQYFGGLTESAIAMGLWQAKDKTYTDKIRILSIVCAKENDSFFCDFKMYLEKLVDQSEVFILRTEVDKIE